MRYEYAPDLQEIAEEISMILFPHVKLDRVRCFRSYGSSSRGTIARCHTIGKLMQKAMRVPAHYALEFLSERFDKMDKEEQVKTIIHELMHIPQSFGGGFRHHDHVCDENIENNYIEYKKKRGVEKTDMMDEDIKESLTEKKEGGNNEKKSWKDFFQI
ncbi:MAG: putative metallopeptidase [Candidatus Pacearchaeota archaeon]